MKVTCHLGCGDIEADGIEGIADHIRILHPDEYGEGPERWPDGRVAVVDHTIGPDDFKKVP